DGEEATALRALLAEYAEARTPGERGPVRGLARLLRRNPTDADRALWEALTRDRRFAGSGFKRQVPVGTHITDFVSFPLRVVIDILPAQESDVAAKARNDKRAWLGERGGDRFASGARSIGGGRGERLGSTSSDPLRCRPRERGDPSCLTPCPLEYGSPLTRGRKRRWFRQTTNSRLPSLFANSSAP